MAEQTLYRASSKLLEQAKKVFGDIVTEAYVTAYYFDTLPISDAMSRLDEDCDRAECDGGFSIEGMNGVVLKFVSGNHVWFSTSEWCTIEQVDIGKMVEA